MTYDPVQTWSVLPVDDVGYLPVSDLLALPDGKLVELVDRMTVTRYTGWRNWHNLWRDKLHVDNARVLDWGCGVGVEAVELARRGCAVTLSDIREDSVALASRVMRLYGFEPAQDHEWDVWYANGSLHHCPDARDILARYSGRCREMRLMLYTSVARAALGRTFAETMDFPGVHADWYTPRRLSMILPDGWRLAEWTPITSNGWYAAARCIPS